MTEQSKFVQVTIDMRGPSAEGDCLDCLVAFPLAISHMRDAQDMSDIPTRMVAHTREAFTALELAKKDLRIIATAASDELYRQAAVLTILDRYTRAYVNTVIRYLFEELTAHSLPTFYILDNTIRDDRLNAAIELFELAGVTVTTPRLHGRDWHTLSSRIRSALAAGSHVAYIEPDATVNHLEAAQQLAAEFACVATFRNLAPADPRVQVLTFLTSAS